MNWIGQITVIQMVPNGLNFSWVGEKANLGRMQRNDMINNKGLP